MIVFKSVPVDLLTIESDLSSVDTMQYMCRESNYSSHFALWIE